MMPYKFHYHHFACLVHMENELSGFTLKPVTHTFLCAMACSKWWRVKGSTYIKGFVSTTIWSAFALHFPSLSCPFPSSSLAPLSSQQLMPCPWGQYLRGTIPALQQVGKESFYLSETSQLAPNKLKYFFSSSGVRGWRSEKWRRDLDFAHLGPAMIFNYPEEGVFYWATRLHTVTCPV